ncbi:MAG: molybdenum cofactor biosynthesis protein MoaE [Terrimicrobiaceae bacterium]|nr:molybdenum cofactor biosynthesis protein MoaE [Terrimicrobiaceae bacterium]
MKVEILIAESCLHLEPLTMERCGAVARFDGIVRSLEDGREIDGSFYESYAPMAEKTVLDILTELGRIHPSAFARVHHRVGFVPVGETAISMDAHTKHRAGAFAVLQTFMDRLKKDVPIWKKSAR